MYVFIYLFTFSTIPPIPRRLRRTFQIEMEAAIRKLDRLQVSLEVPSFRHKPGPARFLRETYICLVCMAGRGGSESELRTVRRDARR